MKKVLISLVLIAASWFAVHRYYIELGHWLYQNGQAAEAWWYGFERQQVDIGEMTLSLYQHSNPGKPVIVMLHGFSADKMVWLRFARHLTAQYQILIPDLAGHGDSPYQAGWDYSVPAQSRRVQQLLDAMQLQSVHLIGNSMGGFISADFAIRYPERTLSVALVNPAGVASPQPSRMQQLLASGRNPFLIDNRAQFDEFYAMTMAKPPLLPDIVLAALAENYQARQSQLENMFTDFIASPGLEPNLAALKAPALLWWGDQDQLLHVSAAEVWQQGIPQLQVHIFNGIGHMPMLEIPKQTARLYQQFLTE
jgi:pimeloyl-ACP methyl ester carboxylesterase